jgi:uncharacterized SAM-binding protein YcdF (DUF218 family)
MARFIFKPIRLAALFIALLIVGFIATAYKIAEFGAQTSTHSGDVAIVLGAAAWGNKPSPVYRERLQQAVLLYKAGRVHWIIFTGGTRETGFPSEAEVGKQFAASNGVPIDVMLVDTDSRTTWQNLEHAKTLMESTDLRTALLVSDPLHMRRAMAMAQDLGIQAETAPTSSSRFHSWSARGKFLWRETWLYLEYCIFGKQRLPEMSV